VRRKKARRSPSLMSTRALQPSHASRRIGGGSIDRWGGGGGARAGVGVGDKANRKPGFKQQYARRQLNRVASGWAPYARRNGLISIGLGEITKIMKHGRTDFDEIKT
jgi:hypothetical protein